jgi:hypothetical protein
LAKTLKKIAFFALSIGISRLGENALGELSVSVLYTGDGE